MFLLYIVCIGFGTPLIRQKGEVMRNVLSLFKGHADIGHLSAGVLLMTMQNKPPNITQEDTVIPLIM